MGLAATAPGPSPPTVTPSPSPVHVGAATGGRGDVFGGAAAPAPAGSGADGHPGAAAGGRCHDQGWDVFLSYRVAADAALAEQLYDKLTMNGVRVWWDKRCLPPGKPWEDGFVDGLLRSEVGAPHLQRLRRAITAAPRCMRRRMLS